MVQINIVTREGETIRVKGAEDVSVMEAIRDAGVGELLALCGGARSCATCHVYVGRDTADLVAPMGEDENDLLDASDYRTELSRLSCQLKLTRGLDGHTFVIAPED
ncbi:2Fe-2S iron-sulfur cluster-binding protein [Brevundimonas sp. SL130]|uniref:2Fe-2S iron-sulfur cluster-binding protein n=1 Tax=Brevundimonas sp. SL130 TaxID=2995143 RepID=UPI00226C9EA9|nr:2Fe-2S iron-sulfur cluster-binding protein [Brevundimonas sp. SL130]WAC58501.1 2Fe-2S iron-sulfur cluster-binding protein [Brevundimonas sp. SL130]